MLVSASRLQIALKHSLGAKSTARVQTTSGLARRRARRIRLLTASVMMCDWPAAPHHASQSVHRHGDIERDGLQELDRGPGTSRVKCGSDSVTDPPRNVVWGLGRINHVPYLRSQCFELLQDLRSQP